MPSFFSSLLLAFILYASSAFAMSSFLGSFFLDHEETYYQKPEQLQYEQEINTENTLLQKQENPVKEEMIFSTLDPEKMTILQRIELQERLKKENAQQQLQEETSLPDFPEKKLENIQITEEKKDNLENIQITEEKKDNLENIQISTKEEEKSSENKILAEEEKPALFYPLHPVTTSQELNKLKFSLLKRGDEGTRILVVGGIQGDEPGGFCAASLLASHYDFSHAEVHIIPNLNFDSIIEKSRGLSGDMNRKFATLSTKDAQYDEVTRLKEYILDFRPHILINLHDGSGFYSPSYVSSLRNPNRWGQSIIIDQASADIEYGNLEEFAAECVRKTNEKISNKNYHFTLHNTHTDKGHVEMEKSLSWFGIRNNIASFGFEVSKEFNRPMRTYYHLLQLESLFDALNIDFTRNFPLTYEGVIEASECNVFICLADSRIIFPVDNLKNQQLGYLPLPKKVNFYSSQAIVAAVLQKNTLNIHYGNNTMTRINTQEYTLSSKYPTFKVRLGGENGKEKEVKLATIVPVQESFFIEHQEGLRINAIGARKEKKIGTINTEAEVEIRKKDFDPRYAIDKAENIFRIEIYEGKNFVGMFLVDFSKDAKEYIINYQNN